MLQVGCFYRACGMTASEFSEVSPCKAQAYSSRNSRVHGEPIREHGTGGNEMWYITAAGWRKLSTSRICYLVDYDVETQEGLLFFGAAVPRYSSSFNYICVARWKTPSERLSLETLPPLTFETSFHLNLSDPVKVHITYMPATEAFTSLRNISIPSPPPLPIGVQEYIGAGSGAPVQGMRLSPKSEKDCYTLYWRYNSKRRPKRDVGGDGGLGEVGSSGGAGGRGKTLEVPPGHVYTQPSSEAPYGRFGDLKLGCDISLLTDCFNNSDEEDDGYNDVFNDVPTRDATHISSSEDHCEYEVVLTDFDEIE